MCNFCLWKVKKTVEKNGFYNFSDPMVTPSVFLVLSDCWKAETRLYLTFMCGKMTETGIWNIKLKINITLRNHCGSIQLHSCLWCLWYLMLNVVKVPKLEVHVCKNAACMSNTRVSLYFEHFVCKIASTSSLWRRQVVSSLGC